MTTSRRAAALFTFLLLALTAVSLAEETQDVDLQWGVRIHPLDVRPAELEREDVEKPLTDQRYALNLFGNGLVYHSEPFAEAIAREFPTLPTVRARLPLLSKVILVRR